MQVFNAKTQQLEDVAWSVDSNQELVATFTDGHFYKFPAGTSKKDLQKLVDLHMSNAGQEVITPEMEATQRALQAESEALVAALNGEKDIPDVPEQPAA